MVRVEVFNATGMITPSITLSHPERPLDRIILYEDLRPQYGSNIVAQVEITENDVKEYGYPVSISGGVYATSGSCSGFSVLIELSFV
jgi:hypothetical protein